MVVDSVDVISVYIPGHVEKGLDGQLGGLDVAHVQQPISVSPRVVGFFSSSYINTGGVVHTQR